MMDRPLAVWERRHPCSPETPRALHPDDRLHHLYLGCLIIPHLWLKPIPARDVITF